jgi:hypothetical protein
MINSIDKCIITLIIFLSIFTYSHFSACFDMIFFKDTCSLQLKEICCMNFDQNYLVAIIAFYGAVIAFFIPFTIDMSSKLKKQFGSEVIAKRFEDEKVVKTLYIKLLINTFIASVILLFYKNFIGISLLISNLIIFLILIYSISIFFDIYKYVKLLKKYTDTDQVLKMLQKEISDAIK